ncbi:MAG: ABC transporter ATP-binding protein [Sulfolobales archaeon]
MRLAIKNLIVEYNSTRALNEVTFDVLSGELTFILGPNGAGKTTLLKAISRLVNIAGGSVYIDGKDLKNYSPKELGRTLAYAGPQVRRELPSTVFEFLLIGRYPHQNYLQYVETVKDVEVVERVAAELNIRELLNRKLSELSSGELQRVLIARALVQEPAILLLDEPAAFLDIRYKIEVLNIIKDLTRKKKLITIIANNDLHLTSLYADKVIVLNSGHVIAVGGPEVLTKELIEEVFKVRVEILNYHNRNLILPITSSH